MSQKILLLLRTTAPETDRILSEIMHDEALDKIDFNDENYSSPLSQNDTMKIRELFSLLGHYDIDSQIKYVEEFSGSFKILKQQYQDYYQSHHRLYIAFSLMGGIFICVLLI
ncbi:MAG: stage III sporulation protein AB [Clostridiales bacterium]|nr:stage III sporulation protein AB [Clostridiales bacterium]